MSFIVTVLVVSVGFVALLALFQRRLIYLPTTRPAPQAATVMPRGEDVTFRTEDGLLLAGWFAPGGGSRAPTVLVFNGNAGDRTLRVSLGEGFRSIGANVLLVDYRGYAGNPGRPTEPGLISDARAALAFVESREDVDSRRLVYFGESLGAAVALALAVERPPAALVLRSPFTSLTDVARVHYPFLPVKLMLKDRYPSIDIVDGLSCPLLVIAGDHDRIVPIGLSQRLFEVAPEPKRFVRVPGADHNDAGLTDGDPWIEKARIFLERHLPPAD